ncbi:hypothetical protein TanjilG_19048 [Lupinus angustifolius]|uniref:Uncharacterized protein n=1 Tax=Lupinus angustifolius TaxID=3871 RepID=A0A4P1RRP4_LUPAN|nr:hypothetical protein TanjilG_19048 [Lupinus angustifolius]
MASSSVDLEGKESTQIEKCSSKTTFLNTIFHYGFMDDAKKNILSNWKQMMRAKKREKARLNLDLIKNTAGFNDNMEAMRDFEKLVGCTRRQ